MSDLPTLLVVDDHAAARDLIVRILERGGFPCRAASNLEQLDALLGNNGNSHPAVIILPAEMATGTANDLVRRHPAIKLLLTCVRPPECPLCPDLSCSHMGCLEKPGDFRDPEILLSRVRELLAK